ncbi:subtilisin-like protein [Coniochaeta ligniaria NRRL 30616]|uniref:Subtilisin-like protein n=1 Tax=Coniochaeta ligniaria NRRL 30616 TaxID=1408157 RepID=A0A1J7IYR0_9PEZI|nr:subtilisin-like protein [Coniochaeta ligniaria NRRL 30616]
MSATLTDKWLRRLESDAGGLVRQCRREIVRRRVKILILDTGIDVRNVAFARASSRGLIKRVEDFADPGGDGLDLHGHGTHCAALLCRVAPEAEIYVAKVTRGAGTSSTPDPDLVAKAIKRAVTDWNVDIISLSLGFYENHRDLHDAIKLAYRHNSVIFAASCDNGTSDDITFPAREPGVICIHASNGYGQPLPLNPVPELGKNYTILGEEVESAWCCGPRGKITPAQASITKRRGGTSVATAIAAGVMALVLELAYQSPATQRLGPKALKCLQSYRGMDVVLDKMSKKTGDYRNIVPWTLLKARSDPIVTADYIRYLLEKAR